MNTNFTSLQISVSSIIDPLNSQQTTKQHQSSSSYSDESNEKIRINHKWNSRLCRHNSQQRFIARAMQTKTFYKNWKLSDNANKLHSWLMNWKLSRRDDYRCYKPLKRFSSGSSFDLICCSHQWSSSIKNLMIWVRLKANCLSCRRDKFIY